MASPGGFPAFPGVTETAGDVGAELEAPAGATGTTAVEAGSVVVVVWVAGPFGVSDLFPLSLALGAVRAGIKAAREGLIVPLDASAPACDADAGASSGFP